MSKVYRYSSKILKYAVHRMLTEEQHDIYLIPAKYVTPFDVPQSFRVRRGEISDELEQCLEEAYAVHYFFGNWRYNNK